MKKLTILSFVLLTTSLRAEPNILNDLPHHMIGESMLWLDPASFGHFSSTSKQLYELAKRYKGSHPQAIKLGSGIEVPSYWFFEQLAPEQIIQLGFENPKLLQKMTTEQLNKVSKLETKRENMLATAVWIEGWSKVWGYASTQLWSSVMNQARDHLSAQALTQLGTQLFDKVKDQVGVQCMEQIMAQIFVQLLDQIEIQSVNSLLNQIRSQVEAQIETQIWGHFRVQIGAHINAQVERAFSSYRNLETSEEERIEFINDLNPVIDRVTGVYQYFLVKRLLEESIGESVTNYEAIVDQITNYFYFDERLIILDAVHNTARDRDSEDLNKNIKNFILPIQKFSRTAAN